MGTNAIGDAATVAAQIERKSFQLSYSELEYRSRQKASLTPSRPRGRSATDLFLSQDAQNALDHAKLASRMAKGYSRREVADRTANGMFDFIKRLHEFLGANDDMESRGRFARGIGDQVSARAQELGRGGFERKGRTDFSFSEIKVDVSIESFDLRVKTDQGETSIKIERISLSLSVTEISGSFSASERMEFQAPGDDDATSGNAPPPEQMDAITQLFNRMMGVTAIGQPGPANLLRIFTDLPQLSGGDSGFETSRTDLSA